MIVQQRLLEVRDVDGGSPVHLPRLLAGFRLPSLARGYLLNFNKGLPMDGIKRVSIQSFPAVLAVRT